MTINIKEVVCFRSELSHDAEIAISFEKWEKDNLMREEKNYFLGNFETQERARSVAMEVKNNLISSVKNYLKSFKEAQP